MYIRQLRIQNLKTFVDTEVHFEVPQTDTATTVDTLAKPLQNVTVLVGINGAGKSTILRAIAMAALAPLLPRGSGYVPRAMVRRTQSESPLIGTVEGLFEMASSEWTEPTISSRLVLRSGSDSFQDRFDEITSPAWTERLFEEKKPGFFLVGYGASRRVDRGPGFSIQAQERERQIRFLRVAGLFEESVVLRPLSTWLPTWDNPGRRKQFIRLFNRILPDVQINEEPIDGEYLFRLDNTELPFDALSDGYKAYIGWLVDLLYHVAMATRSGKMLFEIEGIVMVDEIDLHLHPAWQQTVIPKLASAMPKMQFIFTSHSPLVAGSLFSYNLRLLRHNANQTEVLEPQNFVHGLSADQILTSPYFGLVSTRDPGFVEQLRDTALLARQGDAQSAQDYLRMLTLGSAGVAPASPKSTAKKKPKVIPAKKGVSKKKGTAK